MTRSLSVASETVKFFASSTMLSSKMVKLTQKSVLGLPL